ncbi:hypothetical protein M2336_001040 [Sphingobium sp. B1D7B]|uniref:hypothetical protein n=1 Tax=Sphingobium sp. B1D7B TaxID=2940578 RepID=UPI00222595BD|nr:hypothetical protein [Sphingobium sp. B1D7B]MCW2404411.1 hypothetical protein [Sphingobium sp. B1D7B]
MTFTKRCFLSNKHKRQGLVALCAIFLAGGWTTAASAQWLLATGRISAANLSYAENQAFRINIYTNEVNQFPGCNGGFGFLNVSDSNYEAKVATLLTAASQSKTVEVSYTKDSSGWCAITDIRVQF